MRPAFPTNHPQTIAKRLPIASRLLKTSPAVDCVTVVSLTHVPIRACMGLRRCCER
jgi:hypothetical protein